jgi:hypothetical protein
MQEERNTILIGATYEMENTIFAIRSGGDVMRRETSELRFIIFESRRENC